MGSIDIDSRLTVEQIKRYDQWMDSECVKICDALNALPGIETFESCCGHGNYQFMIFFMADSADSVKPLLMEICDRRGWTVEIKWANGGDAIYYGLFSPHSDLSNCQRIYTEANEIAEGLQ